MLVSAIRDLLSSDESTARKALKWVDEKRIAKKGPCFTYLECCNYLGMDPHVLRNEVIKRSAQVKSRLSGKGRRTTGNNRNAY